MNDRELLELAAKAAGIEHRGGDWQGLFVDSLSGGSVPTLKIWNPLTDDGDALRLAVKVRLCVAVEDDFASAIDWDGQEYVEEFGLEVDRYAATRRAIVRAAAEIGKNKEEA